MSGDWITVDGITLPAGRTFGASELLSAYKIDRSELLTAMPDVIDRSITEPVTMRRWQKHALWGATAAITGLVMSCAWYATQTWANNVVLSFMLALLEITLVIATYRTLVGAAGRATLPIDRDVVRRHSSHSRQLARFERLLHDLHDGRIEVFRKARLGERSDDAVQLQPDHRATPTVFATILGLNRPNERALAFEVSDSATKSWRPLETRPYPNIEQLWLDLSLPDDIVALINTRNVALVDLLFETATKTENAVHSAATTSNASRSEAYQQGGQVSSTSGPRRAGAKVNLRFYWFIARTLAQTSASVSGNWKGAARFLEAAADCDEHSEWRGRIGDGEWLRKKISTKDAEPVNKVIARTAATLQNRNNTQAPG